MIQANQCVTNDHINEALAQLKGAIMIVYPMGLPPYDPIELEFKNQEELEGTQDSLDVIPETEMTIWFSGKDMQRGKLLSDYAGRNEKTTMIVKIQKVCLGVFNAHFEFQSFRKEIPLHLENQLFLKNNKNR